MPHSAPAPPRTTAHESVPSHAPPPAGKKASVQDRFGGLLLMVFALYAAYRFFQWVLYLTGAGPRPEGSGSPGPRGDSVLRRYRENGNQLPGTYDAGDSSESSSAADAGGNTSGRDD